MGTIKPLDLPGWDNFSTWGYDSGARSFYAQLTHNTSNDDNGPDTWITPGGQWPVVESTETLADLIAQATTEPLERVRAAMYLPP